MKQSILGEVTRVEFGNPKTLVEAGVKIYQEIFFMECFGDIVNAVFDSTAALMIQPLLCEATSLEIIVAVEECQSSVVGISQNQLAWFLWKKKGKLNEWYMAFVIDDKIRSKDDEKYSFVGGGGKRSVLRAVYFDWYDGGWYLYALQVSYPNEWPGGYRILSRKLSESQS